MTKTVRWLLVIWGLAGAAGFVYGVFASEHGAVAAFSEREGR